MAVSALASAMQHRLVANRTHCRLARGFQSAPHRRASILFALSALSNSRETQHFNKITRLSRIEHSPPLKLIQTSEVAPFPCPNPPPPPASRPLVHPAAASRSALRVWDRKALQIGRVVLTDQARRTHRLTQAFARAKRREAMRDVLSRKERAAWHQEREKMRTDLRSAGVWILLSISTATALATWRFWPSTEAPRESADLGRKIAARAAAAMPLPAASSVEPTVIAPTAVPAQATHSSWSPPSHTTMTSFDTKPMVFKPTAQASDHRWWRNLFWKQQ